MDPQTSTTQETSCVGIYIGEELAKYGFGQGHPFGPDRMDAFWYEAQRRGLDQKASLYQPVAATEEDITRFHAPEYVDFVRRRSLQGGGFLDFGDTPAFPGIFEAAAYVVGSALDAVARIMRNECRCIFIPIAGLHHARPNSAAGFCVFNDCGVAIESLKRDYGLERIAYIDIDAHHGDGVFYSFEADPSVWIADIHEDGRSLYPGTGRADETGRGDARGTKLNIPLRPHANDNDFLRAWEQVETFLEQAQPQFFYLQCGADSLGGDPLTHLEFSAEAHRHAAARLRVLAERYAHGRLLACGGGGYNRSNLATAWCAVLEGLLA